LKEKVKDFDLFIVPYENEKGMKATKEALDRIKSGMKIGILIGPEGGFEEREIDALLGIGAIPLSLGSRILRTETAAITAVGMCMLHIEMNVKE
jgi:16S rRNA (uracil1498-N3)-methyltransferase